MRKIKAVVCCIFLVITWVSCASVKSTKKNINAERIDQETTYYFLDGMRFFITEDFLKSSLYFKKACEVNPRSAPSFYMAAYALSKVNLTESIPYAKKAIELDDKNENYYWLAATIYSSLKEYNHAIEIYNRLLKQNTDQENVYLNLASVYLLNSNYRQALDCYDKVEKKISGPIESISRQKQSIYVYLNDINAAIQEGNKLINQFPDEPLFMLSQIDFLFTYQRKQEAFDLLEKAEKKFPNDSFVLLTSWEMHWKEGMQSKADKLAFQIFEIPDIAVIEKIRILSSYVERIADEKIKKIAFNLADRLLKLYVNDSDVNYIYGYLLIQNKEPEAALKYYFKSLELNQNNFEVWKSVIWISLQSNKLDTATLYADKGIELFPTQSEIWYLGGLIKYMRKKYAESISYLEETKKLASSNQQLTNQSNILLGDIFHFLHKYEQSDQAFEEVLKNDPDNEYVLNNYSYFLSLRKEKVKQAKEMASKLIQKYPDNPTYLDTYGWILYVLKEYTEALRYLEKAIAKEPNGAIVEHYGDVLFQLGKTDQAVEQWKKAKVLGDGSDLLDKKISTKKLYE